MPDPGARIPGDGPERAVHAVVFWDIDGTLLTTARAGVFALERALRDLYDAGTDLQGLPTSGLTDAGVAALVLEAAGRESSPGAIDAFLRSYEQSLPESLHLRAGRVLPNVLEILGCLEQRTDVLSLLLTGNTPEGARAKLDHYGLERFFTAGGAFCADAGPREEIAHRARKVAEALAGETLAGEQLYVIGDTPHDVRCGRAIEARTVAVATGTYDIDELAAAEPWLVLEELPAPRRFLELLGIGDSGKQVRDPDRNLALE